MAELWKLEERVTFALRELYQRYGYAPFKMSKFEAYDLYMQNKEFLVSDGIITFTDTDGTLMALKPDVTLSIVKNFRKERTPIQKVCYSENVYRISGAGHNYREIMQTGLECLGDVGLYEISEVICLAAASLKTISDDFVLDISHMGIVSQLLSELQLSEADVTAVLGFLGEKNTDALNDLLGAKRAEKLVALLNMTGSISAAIPALLNLGLSNAVTALESLGRVLEQKGLAQYVRLDFSIISNRNYYNDFVFRGYVRGIPAAVLAGGQYDRLMEKMNKQAKGIGFAVYLDQLELLDNHSSEYDVDTILVYKESDDLCEISAIADSLSETGVLLMKQMPAGIRYRRLFQFENGRLNKIEEHG